MKYDPYEAYATDGVARCELCIAWPPNAYGEAYGDGSSFVCRACGLTVTDRDKACGLFELDGRIRKKVDAIKEGRDGLHDQDKEKRHR